MRHTWLRRNNYTLYCSSCTGNISLIRLNKQAYLDYSKPPPPSQTPSPAEAFPPLAVRVIKASPLKPEHRDWELVPDLQKLTLHIFYKRSVTSPGKLLWWLINLYPSAMSMWHRPEAGRQKLSSPRLAIWLDHTLGLPTVRRRPRLPLDTRNLFYWGSCREFSGFRKG